MKIVIRETSLIGILAAALLVPSGTVEAQRTELPSINSRLVGLGGSDFFLAPHALFAHDAFTLKGEAVFGRGTSDYTEGRASIDFALPRRFQIEAMVSTVDRSLAHESARTWEGRLGLSKGFAGASIGLSQDQASAGDFNLGTRAMDVRAWADVGVLLGLTLRTADVEEEGTVLSDTTHVILDRFTFHTPRESKFFRADRYSEMEVDVGIGIGSAFFTVVGGHRFERNAEAPSVNWAFARLITPISNRVDAVAEFGRNAGHPTLGRGPAGFSSIGLRVSLFGSRSKRGERDVPWTLPPLPAALAILAEVEAEAGVYQLVIRAPAARTIEVKGSFTGWEPRELARLGLDRWGVSLEPGVHMLNIRINDGVWTVPSNVTVIPDEFSGAPVALVIVGSGGEVQPDPNALPPDAGHPKR